MSETPAMGENDRLLPVDAVRGIAMFFIGVSHISFYLIYDSGTLASHARAIGYVATPNFLLMSGLACGYQLAHAPATATALRIVDRGLFALLVGHLLVTASLVYMVPPGTAFEHIVITDSIGALLCLAPLLKHTPARTLLWLGAAVYVLCTTFALAWHPTSPAGIVGGALLLAINDGDMPDIGWTSPTLPYLGIFLVGVGLGKLMHASRRGGGFELLSKRLAVAGSLAILAAMGVNIGRHFLKPFLESHATPKNWADVVLTTLNVRHDMPPTLAYALFYGGIGIALVGFLGLLPRRPEDSRLVRWAQVAAVVGRASFVSYIVQQWVIDFIPEWMGFDSWLTPLTCPVYLLASTIIMYWIARVWGQWRGNRYMTLGLKPGFLQRSAGAFATVVVAVVFLNALALLNAPRLTPGKLDLFPPNPHSHSWVTAKLARQHH
jgi:uncharacterized membrane protein